MRRTNTFVVRPRSEEDAELLRELLDASASLWNELTYERRQNYFDGNSIWDTDDYRKQYVGVLGSATDTIRYQDTLTCECGFEGHADLVSSESFLRRQTDVPRPMARPVRFEWDDHDWSAIPYAHESPEEVRTDRSIHG